MTAKEDVKYVLVETVLDKKDKPISELINTCKIGLLKGLKEATINQDDKPSQFLLLKGRKDELLSLNCAYYNVLSIEKFNGLSKTITYFRASKEEQESANAVLEKIIEDMKEAGKMLASDGNIIDTSTYAQIPNSFSSTTVPVKTSAPIKPTGSPLFNNTRCNYNKPTPVKSDKPAVIKRKSKVPTKAMLEEMEKKIKLIMQGKYEAELPEIAGDPPGAKSTTAADDLEDDYSASYYMG